LRLVQTVSTEEARSALIEMARVWSRLSEEQDAPILPRVPDASQPVIQQQQQQQPPKPKKDDKEE
jgi:hypothetical protein